MAAKKKALRGPTAKVRAQASLVHERLARAIPKPHVELRFQSPWELLIATILAAQSTDKLVNTVLPKVVERWPTPAALAKAPQEEVEEVVKSTGFFRNKAKAIRETSRVLTERFGGAVPRTMEEMLELPGVARKTANVVLGAGHGVITGVPVDTHCARVSQRLRLTKQTDPEKIETVLCGLFPRDEWILVGHRFVLHGRHVCTAKAPRCKECPLNELCPSRMDEPEGEWTERAELEKREMTSRAEGFSLAHRRA
ncbi:MAG TPA: endonuclease III [Myxococcaceae bacterium]|nr:endonuclease III [Myxococcaceae bacterium]